jgi:hypothetical protein
MCFKKILTYMNANEDKLIITKLAEYINLINI